MSPMAEKCERTDDIEPENDRDSFRTGSERNKNVGYRSGSVVFREFSISIIMYGSCVIRIDLRKNRFRVVHAC